MNRRQVFTLLGIAALIPGELWMPTRRIFLPPSDGWPVGTSVIGSSSEMQRIIKQIAAYGRALHEERMNLYRQYETA